MIKVSVIKRINALEQRIKKTVIPDSVIVYYDDTSMNWIVDEHYSESKSIKTIHLKHYKDYVFHPDFEGNVIIDLLSAPEEYAGNLHRFIMKDLKEEYNLEGCGISLEAVSDSSDAVLKQSFIVFVH